VILWKMKTVYAICYKSKVLNVKESNMIGSNKEALLKLISVLHAWEKKKRQLKVKKNLFNLNVKQIFFVALNNMMNLEKYLNNLVSNKIYGILIIKKAHSLKYKTNCLKNTKSK
jgi:hypothetical protein